MSKKNIILNTIFASTILLGGLSLSSCDDNITTIENEITFSLTLSNENGGSISFYKDGSSIDLTDEETVASLEVGDSISFRITINSGYNFESITLNGSYLTTSTSSSTGNRTGSFTVLEGANALVLNIAAIETKVSDFSFTYNETTLEATVTNYTCSTTVAPSPVVIPETIDVDGVTYKVTGVADNAFISFSKTIDSIYISKNIKEVGTKAFTMSVSSLESFIVDSENEYFATYNGILYDIDLETAIAIPNGLTSVTLYEGTKEIGDYASYQGAIQTLDIPSSVTKIGVYCFENSSLATITGGEGLVEISEYAFRYTNVTSFTFGENLETLGEYAFAECELRSIDLSNTKITRLEDGVFYHSDNLTSIDFGENITYIGYDAFWNTGLSTVTFPTSLKTLGDSAFNQSWSLKEVNFNDGLEYIGTYCFDQCYSLTSINLPESITYIGEGAFRAIPAIGNSSSNFTIGDNNTNTEGTYVIIDGVLYEDLAGTYTLHTYPMGIQSSTFGAGVAYNVSTIKAQAFAYNRYLEELVLGTTITKIEANAFYGFYTDSSLEELTLRYLGSVSQLANVDLEEGWNTGLTLKDDVIFCDDGNYTVE